MQTGTQPDTDKAKILWINIYRNVCKLRQDVGWISKVRNENDSAESEKKNF